MNDKSALKGKIKEALAALQAFHTATTANDKEATPYKCLHTPEAGARWALILICDSPEGR